MIYAWIQEKKERLAPVIKEVRELRQQALEIDRKYQDKKKQYDAMMMGMDTYDIFHFMFSFLLFLKKQPLAKS